HVFIRCSFFYRSFLREECPSTRAHRNFNDAQFLGRAYTLMLGRCMRSTQPGDRCSRHNAKTHFPVVTKSISKPNEFSCYTRQSCAVVRLLTGLMEGVNFG